MDNSEKYKSFFEDIKTSIDISGVSTNGIKTFIKLYVGLVCFMRNEHLVLFETKKKFLKDVETKKLLDNSMLQNSFSLRFKVKFDNNEKYILFNATKMVFYSFDINNNRVDKINTILEYENIIYDNEKSIFDDYSNSIIALLLDVAHDNYSDKDGYKDLEELKRIYYAKRGIYRFVVGAGINYGLDMQDWKTLKNNFKAEVDSILVSGACDIIAEKTFNTDYGVFQILKDLDINKYHSLLEKLVLPGNTNINKASTLKMIVEVLEHQKKDVDSQRLLTFNYDTMVESFLKYLDVKSVFIKDKELNNKINIIHSHGLLPSKQSQRIYMNDDYYNSIVLTTDEYISNYYKSSSYGYEQLFEHLDKTCYFVGNSIADYEEQKVISSHFKKYPSQFHFAFFCSKDMNFHAILYKTIFMLKIGVIPLWFSSHDAYIEEILESIK